MRRNYRKHEKVLEKKRMEEGNVMLTRTWYVLRGWVEVHKKWKILNMQRKLISWYLTWRLLEPKTPHNTLRPDLWVLGPLTLQLVGFWVIKVEVEQTIFQHFLLFKIPLIINNGYHYYPFYRPAIRPAGKVY